MRDYFVGVALYTQSTRSTALYLAAALESSSESRDHLFAVHSKRAIPLLVSPRTSERSERSARGRHFSPLISNYREEGIDDDVRRKAKRATWRGALIKNDREHRDGRARIT